MSGGGDRNAIESRSLSSLVFEEEDAAPSPRERDVESSVQVAVRVRPLLALEADSESCMTVHSCGTTISVGRKRFTFDQVFDVHTPQHEFYERRVAGLVQKCLEGFNATIFAYGQTGSGKTHTIMGASPNIDSDDADAGVIPRALKDLFDSLEAKKKAAGDDDNMDYQVSIQFLEIYGEEIRDLLTLQHHHNDGNGGVEGKLTIRDITDEPEVVGATQKTVTTAAAALEIQCRGMLRRVTGATAMNESSSRSHAIFTIIVEQSTVLKNDNNNGDDDDDDEEHIQVTRSKFNFVDLAGAERQKRTGATGRRLDEGIQINQGLLTLGNVISALGDPRKRGRTHIPYRESKLTRILKGSLGGNHKTLMIACVSPAATNMQESLSCLMYANRAKNIQNKAVVNVDAKSRIVQELQGKVKALATDLLKAIDGDRESLQFSRETLVSLMEGGGGGTSSMPPTPSKRAVVLSAADADQRLKETEIELSKTQDLLRQSQNNHDAAEKELHTISAAKELSDLQLSLLAGASDGPVPADALQKAFMEKAVGYEAEIRKLQGALRDAEAKVGRMQWIQDNTTSTTSLDELTSDDTALIEKTETALGDDRDRLMSIRAALSLEEAEYNGTVPTACDVGSPSARSDGSDAEQKKEQEEIDNLTKKYCSDEEEEGDNAECDKNLVSTLRQKQFQADLDELSRSIASKERTIEKLKLTQENYVSMREFYEERLKAMEATLAEKEAERAQLLRDLERAQGGDDANEELKVRLREKEKHIEMLRRKQKDFKNMSAASSRNALQITKMQNEVKNMKKMKVNLMKELREEKRKHSREVKSLKNAATQKEREFVKLQKISNRRELEAEKAKLVSKLQREELGQLKKKLRSHNMTKAGLDPVIVGRREPRSKKRPHSASTGHGREDFQNTSQINVDSLRDFFDKKVAKVSRTEALIEALAKESEEYIELETKIKEIGSSPETDDASDALEALKVQSQFKHDRIRQLAQRLGRIELSPETGSNAVASQSDSFLFDKEFTELCKGCAPEYARATAARVLFGMIVRERRRVTSLARTAASLEERMQSAEKSAEVSEIALRSFIDEHRQEVADLTKEHQEHILSLMTMVKEDSKQSKGNAYSNSDEGPNYSEEMFEKKLLVLANERVALLEDQLSDLRFESFANQAQLEKLAELKEELQLKLEECEVLEKGRNDLNSILRQIRNMVSHLMRPRRDPWTTERVSEIGSSIADLVENALHPSSTSPLKRCRDPSKSAKQRDSQLDRRVLSPRLERHIELMHSSDSESAQDDDEPEWAAEIMEDLALIAEGKIPPALQNSPSIMEEASRLEKSSVFDRLSNPDSFTGTQKRARSNREHDHSEEVPMSIQRGQEKNTSTSIEGSDHASTPTAGGDESNAMGKQDEEVPPENDEQDLQSKSVFDRLCSPSQFTGTQKEKFHETKAKRDRAADDAAGRVLHGILDENVDDTIENVNDRGGSSRIGYTDYANQDVFDRLQKTTTHACAVRQNETLHLETRVNSAVKGHVPARDVAPLSKQRDSKRPSPTGDGSASAGRQQNSDYTRMSVFERLTKRTTEAYAKKSNRNQHD